MIDLIPHRLEEKSNVTVSFALCDFPPDRYKNIAVLQFAGQADNSEYPGSYFFIEAMVAAAVRRWGLDAIVLDMRALVYDWGDEMTIPLMAAHPLPTVVVTSSLNDKGLKSLVECEMGETVEDWLFDSLEDAIAAVDQQVAKS